MKYTILGFSQQALLDYELDVSDALILKVLSDMYVSNNSKIEYRIFENDKYMWITYPYIHKEIPIISQRTIIRKIDILIGKGILKKVNVSSKNGKKGNYLYISFDETYSKLTEYGVPSEPDAKMELGKNENTDFTEPDATLSLNPMPKWHDKDPTTTNPLTNNKTTTKYKLRYIKHKSSCYKFKIKKSSNSSSENLENIKQFLVDKSLDKQTTENILKAVTINSLTLEKVKTAFEHAKVNGKGIGYVVKAMQENWNIPVVKINVVKTTAVEKEQEFIKKTTVEKQEALNQKLPNIELTSELEEKLLNIAITTDNISKGFLITMKAKNKTMYENTLKKYLIA